MPLGKVLGVGAIGSILALGTWYYGTIDSLSDSGGTATVEPAPIPDTPIPEDLQAQADRIVRGYEDHYFGPIDQLGNQVTDPSVPDPQPKPLPTLPAEAQAQPQPAPAVPG